ncbi:MAG: hypothetical protein CFE21_04030 [Bacteroidetes bacterium B1(2017)]|nr:MAG: hypothetical protein CFE21_04030 [Bacteroidetes bacterium B1(2017)]
MNTQFWIKHTLSFLFLSALVSCQSNTPKTSSNLDTLAVPVAASASIDTPNAQAAIVGNDLDEHNCKGSAGYQWSVLKNTCVRIFEDGKPFVAYGNNTDKTLGAFVIFASNSSQAEVYLPHTEGSIILTATAKLSKQATSGTLYENTQEHLSIVLQNGTQYLKLNNDLIFVAK